MIMISEGPGIVSKIYIYRYLHIWANFIATSSGPGKVISYIMVKRIREFASPQNAQPNPNPDQKTRCRIDGRNIRSPRIGL